MRLEPLETPDLIVSRIDFFIHFCILYTLVNSILCLYFVEGLICLAKIIVFLCSRSSFFLGYYLAKIIVFLCSRSSFFLGYYQCPAYYYPNRGGFLNRPSYVVTLDLKQGACSVDHWVRRAVGCLLSLDI